MTATPLSTPNQASRASATLLLACVLAGCGVPPAPEPVRSAPPTLASDRVEVRTAANADGTLTLEFRSRGDANGDGPLLARCEGVTLVLADAPGDRLRVFFSTSQRDGPNLTLGCTPLRDHRVELRLTMAGDGLVHVDVGDRVGLRSPLLELSLDYEFVSDGPIDEAESPHVHPRPEHAIGDRAFRSPLAFLRSGARAIAVLPDIGSIQRDRRIPQMLELNTVGSVWIRHGLCHLRPAQDGDTDVMTRDGAAPTPVAGETLRFAHRLRLIGDAAPHTTLAALHDEVWRDSAAPDLARSALPLGQNTWDSLVTPITERLLGACYRELRYAGTAIATLTDAPDSGAAPAERESTWLAGERNVLLPAWGLALRARRVGDADLAERASRVAALALMAPRRGGLFPSVFERSVATGHTGWLASAPGSSRQPDAYHVVDSCTTAVLLLRHAAAGSVDRDRALDACGQLARFLLQNQEPSGAIAAVYEGDHLRPLREGSDAETGAAAWFLAELGDATGDARLEQAAVRAVQFVADRVARRTAWRAGSRGARARDRDGPDDARSTARSLLALTRSTQAALSLGLDGVAIDLLGQLAHHQWAWSPSWLDVPRIGGFDATDERFTRFDATSAFAAAAMLDGYRRFERREYLQRGATALRCGLLQADDGVYGVRAACAAIVEATRADLGQGVVDVAGGFAEGLDSIWFEDVAVQGDTVRFRLLTHAALAAPATITFRGCNAATAGYRVICNDADLGTFGVAELARGVPLRARRAARIDFRPPRWIRADSAWRPRARFDGPLSDDASVTVEIAGERGLLAALPMARSDPAGTLTASAALSTVGLTPGTELGARIVVVEHGRLSQAPIDGHASIAVGTMDCIDPGDGDELELGDATGTRVVPFADGREYAREAPHGTVFRYSLPIDASAASVGLAITLTGALELTAGDLRVHVDGADAPAGIRRVEVDLADPRLWAEGVLRLGFACARPAGTLTVARIEYLAEGETLPVPVASDPSTRSRKPDPQIRVAVVPVRLADSERDVAIEDVRQALFGGPEYRVTPAPGPSVTTGSAATLVTLLSGGTSSLLGEFMATAEIPAEAPSRGAAGIVEALRESLARARSGREVEAIVLVHADGSLPPGLDGESTRVDGLPVVFVAERGPDGSLLSSGHCVSSLLRAMFGFPSLAGAEHGSFGVLALTARGGGHIPTGLAGVHQVAAGWADPIAIAPASAVPELVLEFTSLLRGRRVYRLPYDELPGRGNLWIEARDEPRLEAPGVLAYWEFGATRPLLVRGAEPAIRPSLLRLSPNTPTLATPFSDGAASDLFRSALRLDGDSVPSLATPQGEVLWRVSDLSIDAQGRATCRLAYRGIDLLARDDVPWFTGRNGRFGPLTRDGRNRHLGVVADTDHGFLLDSGTRAGNALRATWLLSPADGLLRLFGRFDSLSGGGRGAITVWLDAERLVTFPVTGVRGGERFQVDLPHLAARGLLTVEFAAHEDRLSAQLDQLLAVPIARALHRVALPEDTRGECRLTDGIHYGRLFALTLDARGTRRVSAPVLLPPQRTALRLHAGLAESGAPARVLATVRLRSIDGSRNALPFDRLPIERGPGPTSPMLAFAEIAGGDEPQAAILDLDLEGPPGAVLYVVSLDFVRP